MSDVQRFNEEAQKAGKDGLDAAVSSFGEVNKGSFEDGTRAFEQLTGEIVATEGPVVSLEIEHLVHDEADVTQRGAVGMQEAVVRMPKTAAFYLRVSPAKSGAAVACRPERHV